MESPNHFRESAPSNSSFQRTGSKIIQQLFYVKVPDIPVEHIMLWIFQVNHILAQIAIYTFLF